MKKIGNKIIKASRFIETILKTILCKKRAFILGTPIHGNLGDQAIVYAERKFIRDNFNRYEVIEIESSLVKWFCTISKKIIKSSDLIFIHGGGFIGSLWLNEEKMFRIATSTFKEHKSIVLPQTIYFSDDEYGKKVLLDSQKSYGENYNTVFCCREKYSYEFMDKAFPMLTKLLIPDMVLYLDVEERNINRSNALFCIRHDREKINYNFDKIQTYLKEKYNFNIDYTDTVVKKRIYPKKREKALNSIFEKFSRYKIIVTDRLHGMVFAYITHTPCLVFENKSYKVKGLYEWIKDVNYIHLCSNDTDELEIIDKLINCTKNTKSLRKEFKPLINFINNIINDGREK